MNNHSVSRWMASVIATLLVLSVISTLDAAQAAPTRQAATTASKPAPQQAAKPAQVQQRGSVPLTSVLSFAAHVDYPVGSGPYSVAVADLDHNGTADFVTANSSSSNVSVRLGDGSGGFGTQSSYPVGSTPQSVALDDFNNDGIADVVTANSYSNNVSVRLGNGDGSFGAESDYPVGTAPYGVAVGNFNGNEGIVAVNSSNNNTSVLLGNGNGGFGIATNYLVGTYPSSVAVGDFNGDGNADLVTANANNYAVSVLLGNGTGSFGNANNFSVGSFPQAVAVGDFNGDGKTDIVTTNYNGGNVSVLLGVGDGTFGAATNFAVGSHPDAVAVGDFNGDGKPDLAITNAGDNNVAVLLGDGAGSFGAPNNFAVGALPLSVAVGDFNNDGKPDLIATNYSDNSVSLLLNTSAPAATPTLTPVPTATATPNPCAAGWSEQASYPSNIAYQAMAAQGGSLYSFGGINSVAMTATYKFDGNSWNPLAPLPEARFTDSAVSDGTNLYILNGAVPGSGSHTHTLYRYNVTANTYTLLANPIEGTSYQAAVYLAGKIYRIGGYGSSGPLSSVEVYDIASNAWTTDTNYPIAIFSASAIAMNGYIYVMGGQDSSSALSAKTYRFDPATHTWDDGSIADLPQTRASSATGIVNGQIVLAGGNVIGGAASDSVITWDPASNWISLPNMVAPRFAGAGGTLSNALYVVGGLNADSFTTYNDNQRYAPNGCSTPTPPPLPTNTPAPSNTPGGPTNTPGATNTPVPTNTPGGPTSTSVPTSTPRPTNTPGGPTPTDCANPFVDTAGDIFYPAIHYLYCRSVVNGTDASHFSPHGTSTRGQFAKVVVLGFGLALYTPSGAQDFTDVAPGYFAYAFIETGFHNGVLSGFDNATCIAAGATPPCYLPNRPITRGQLTKLVVNAAHYPLVTPGAQTYSDVPPSNVFYLAIETAHAKTVINGYPDNTFRPNQNIQRDQMCQIVYKGVTTP